MANVVLPGDTAVVVMSLNEYNSMRKKIEENEKLLSNLFSIDKHSWRGYLEATLNMDLAHPIIMDTFNKHEDNLMNDQWGGTTGWNKGDYITLKANECGMSTQIAERKPEEEPKESANT